LDQFPEYHTKILLGDFNAKVGSEDIFKPTDGNNSLDEISKDEVSSKTWHIKKSVESAAFLHCNTHKYTWTSPDGKTQNQT
jgi:hypothetical protein